MLDDGYVVYPWDLSGAQKCRVMRDLGLISVYSRELVDCVNPLDHDYRRLTTEEKRCNGHIIIEPDSMEEGWDQCPTCGRPIYFDEKVHKRQIWYTHHKPSAIGKYVEELARNHLDDIQDTGDGISWHISRNGLSGLMAILEYLPLEMSYGILSGRTDGFLGISVGNFLSSSATDSYRAWNVITLENLIQNPEQLESAILGRLVHLPEPTQIEDCRRKLEQYVSRMNKTGAEFEEFCHELETEILSRPERSRKLLAGLMVNRTLMYRSIRLGGAGFPDIVRLPLYQYLSDFLTFAASIEAKQYVTSSLTVERLGTALVHSERYTGSKLIVYVSSTDVAPSVWDGVLRVREHDGGFRYLVIDSRMMAFLMVGLKIDHLLTIS